VNGFFLGIHYSDCYRDYALEYILKSYIGRIEPFIFDKPTDRVIHSTHWSNADELIEYCKEFVRIVPEGIFPTEGWLRKRGKWAGREGPAYNTLSIYIKKWIGGIRKLRNILNQPESNTISWSKDKAIYEYQKWYEKYNFTPTQARTRRRCLSSRERKKAQNIANAIRKYASTTEDINKQLGIEPKKLTKWTREKIVSDSARLFNKYALTPTQLSNLTAKDIEIFVIAKKDITLAKQIVDRINAYFRGSKELYSVLGITPIDKRILKRKIAQQASELDCC